ncbi:MAG: beta-class carbonic anhydrase [Acidimicrobiales bacterium]
MRNMTVQEFGVRRGGNRPEAVGSVMLSFMFDDLLEANLRYASGFSLQGLPGRAGKEFALVTCMDTRIEPLAILGLAPGDSKILRNAGGRVTEDVLRSLILATNFLGVRRIAVMHHTECALADQTDEAIRAGLPAGRNGDMAGWAALAMPDPDGALAGDVESVRTCSLLPPGVEVEGWRYAVATGRIDRVILA